MQMFIFIIALICFLGSGGYLAKYFWERHVSSKNMDDIKSLLVENDTIQINEARDESTDNTNILLRYSQLHEINPDFAGWIEIPGTTIDYPVMYVEGDNDTYLHANFKKEWDGGGTPFIDGRCSMDPRSTNLIIYGHNMNDKSMFQP
ncbi:MAG: class B sortase [Frisingicoccus sp.]|nr:class B sortase [Frisingicoccus sp.]